MKKTFFVVFLAVIALVLANGAAFAISGPCSDCHTMHNSQDGDTDVNGTGDGLPNLLRGDCIWCHTDATLGNKLTTNTTSKAPNVLYTGTPALPSGVFSLAGASNRQHNVANTAVPADGGLTYSQAEAFYTATTPGDQGAGARAQGSNDLTCAGASGCHGNTTDGITGYHHGTNTGFRFLTTDGTVANGVTGNPSANWTETATSHNVYAAGTTGISAMCASCHGDFHGTANTNAASPFKRHPTDSDAVIDNVVGVIGDINVASDSFYQQNPFAWSNLGSASTSANYSTLTNAQAACVSCHRAHGSIIDADNLRFVYSDQVAGSGFTQATAFGCVACHQSQR